MSKRKPLSEEHKEKIRQKMLGRKFTEESLLKMSISSIGKKGTYGHKGKKHTKESIAKIKDGLRKKFPNGRKHSKETRNKMSSSAKKGESSHLWKGGITPINKTIRYSSEYRVWRDSVFKRDDYTCVFCKKRGVILNADHIKPFAYFPKLRFVITNGRTLCIDCHSTTDSYKGRAKNYKHS